MINKIKYLNRNCNRFLLSGVQHKRYSNELLLGGNPLLASVVLLAWQAMRQSASAIHYFLPEKCNLSTHTRTCVGGFCDANYMNTEGVNLIRGTESDESRFLHGTISRFVFHAESLWLLREVVDFGGRFG